MFNIPLKKRVKFLEDYNEVLKKMCDALMENDKDLYKRIRELESKVK